MTRKARAEQTREAADRVLDLDRYVPALITFIANKLSRSATKLYQERFGVNVTEWRILALLAIEPGISASRICSVIGFDRGPVSRTLSVMQTHKLIAIIADPRDARSHRITLTAHGRKTHDQIIAVALERERRLLGCLKADERKTLSALLLRVHGNLAAVDGAGGPGGEENGAP